MALTAQPARKEKAASAERPFPIGVHVLLCHFSPHVDQEMDSVHETKQNDDFQSELEQLPVEKTFPCFLIASVPLFRYGFHCHCHHLAFLEINSTTPSTRISPVGPLM
jgi:hypothetical protein